MPKMSGHREVLQFEEESVIVGLKEPRFIEQLSSIRTFDDFDQEDPPDLVHSWHYEQHRAIKALRLDAIPGEATAFAGQGTTVVPGSGESVARGFADLLAGIKVKLVVGQKVQWAGTFVRGFLNGSKEIQEYPPDLLPHIQHAVAGPFPRDVWVEPKQSFQIITSYNGLRVPLKFLRVVALGVTGRDVFI